MARNRELSLRLQGADAATSARSRWGWNSHNIEPVLLSAALALSLHAAVFSVPVRTQPTPDFPASPPEVRSVRVRTLPPGAAANAGRGSSAIPVRPDAFGLPHEAAVAVSQKSVQGSPLRLVAVPAQPSPPISGPALRIAGALGDEDFFPRQALDVGPHPTLPVVIDYPRFEAVGGTHVGELSLFIDEAGKVVRVRVDGKTLPSAMEEAARTAFMGTVFSPGIIDGLPVRSKIRIEVIFEEGAAAR